MANKSEQRFGVDAGFCTGRVDVGLYRQLNLAERQLRPILRTRSGALLPYPQYISPVNKL